MSDTAPMAKPRGGTERKPRRRRATIAAGALAVVLAALVAEQSGVRRLSGADFAVRDPLGATMRKQVERLASPAWGGRKPATAGNDAAAKYLAEELAAAGAAPLPSVGSYLVPLPSPALAATTHAAPGAPLGHNVIGFLPAAAASGDAPPAAGAIVLGAHFDHLGATEHGVLLGADDNASSVAVLLGAVASLREKPLKHPVFIVFFNTEEAPYFGSPLQGSRAFMRSLPREIGSSSSILLAVILDLIGGAVWRTTADTVFACGAETALDLPDLVDRVREERLDVRRFGMHMVENIPGYAPQAFSDYDVFRERGVPFLFLSSGRTPRYHEPTDLPDTLHYDRMARTARWITALVAEVDGRPAPFTFAPSGADLRTDAATLRFAIGAAASPLRWIPGTSPITAFRLLQDRSRIEAMSAPGYAFTRDDVLALERASFRLQCLLYSFPVCFTL